MRFETKLWLCLGSLLLVIYLVLGSRSREQTVSTEILNASVAQPKLPSLFKLTADAVKLQDVKKTLVLEDKNTVVIRGPITDASVAKAMMQLRKLSKDLSASTPIYLVLDTPGGSVIDGLDFIEFCKALPQRVHTVTLFAASMGFQIVQNLNTRFIARNGQLMSHRAFVSGLQGQIKGELESRYHIMRRSVDYLDFIAASRMNLDPKTYQDLIVNEYWVYGYDAVADKAADEEVALRCGDTLDGIDVLDFQTFLGSVRVQFSKCPLIRPPLKISFMDVRPENHFYVGEVLRLAFTDKPEFVREFIMTNKFFEIFR